MQLQLLSLLVWLYRKRNVEGNQLMVRAKHSFDSFLIEVESKEEFSQKE